MNILAVETSSTIAAVSIINKSTILGEYLINNNKTHSQKLLPLIKTLLENINLSLSSIDLYAVSIGPGSFTGLRIGVTTIKSLAFALNKPVIGISTLDALAYNACLSNKIICPMIDARNDQVYTAFYKINGNVPKHITDYRGVTITQLIESCKSLNQEMLFLGDGALLHHNILKNELKHNFEIAPNNLNFPKASSVAALALEKASLGFSDDYFNLAPFYLRKSQAERLFGTIGNS